MKFSKYHGCKNDFLLFVAEGTRPKITPEQVQALCDRHTGVGADGVALVSLPAGQQAPSMRIFNADGTLAEMCGNALRCVVKHLLDHALVPRDHAVQVQTDAGLLSAEFTLGSDALVAEVTVDMGPPHTQVAAHSINTPHGHRLDGYTVSMGNPHFVVFSEHPQRDAEEFGRYASTHHEFPEGTNASFARIIDDTRVDAVVYERGAGLTFACGTGACAIATVGRHLQRLRAGDITVQLPGGVLSIALSEAGHLMMRGPATWVFDGELERHGTHSLR